MEVIEDHLSMLYCFQYRHVFSPNKIRTALRADPGSGVKYTYRLHSSNVETSVPRLSSVYFSKLQLEESIDTWNGT